MQNTNTHTEKIFLAVFLFLAVCCTLLAISPNSAFWISDGGNKFIQLTSQRSDAFPAIGYPAESIDPEKRFFPASGHHFRIIDNDVHSFYPPYFSWISRPFYRLFGWTGLFVIPLVSTLGCMAVLYRIGVLLELPMKSVPPVLTGFATPMFFYSITFWEHTLVVFFSTTAVFFILKAMNGSARRGVCFFFAGILLGVAAVFREETYVFFAAVFVACLFQVNNIDKKPIVFMTLGFLAAITPLWFFQYRTYQHILGLHSAVYNSFSGETPLLSQQGVIRKLSNFFFYLFRFDAIGPDGAHWTKILVMPMAVSALAGLFFSNETIKGRGLKIIVLFFGSAFSIVLTVMLVINAEPVFNTIFTQAFITATPFTLFFLLDFRKWIANAVPDERLLGYICLFYIIGTCLCLNQRDVGVIWGGRHFLSIYPLVIVLSWLSFRKWTATEPNGFFRRTLPILAVVLIFCGLINQFHGVKTLLLKKSASAQMVAAAKSTRANILVTDIFWLPEELGAIYHQKKMMQVDSDQNFTDLIELLKNKKINDFALVVAENPQFRVISRASMEKLMAEADLFSGPIVSLKGVAFLGVRFFYCRFKS